MSSLCKTCFSLSALYILSYLMVQPARAQVVYDQPWQNLGIFASQVSNSGQVNTLSFDDFSLANSAFINQVTLVGTFDTPGTQGTITGFRVEFLSDNNNSPGNQLYLTTLPGNGNQTVRDNNPNNFPIYDYSISLPMPFGAQANTKYWLSIAAQADIPPQWLWFSGTGGDNLIYQQNTPNGPFTPTTFTDLAFSLSVVPEPGTLTLLLSSSVGGGLFLRRRYMCK